jgi:hypothetical protein
LFPALLECSACRSARVPSRTSSPASRNPW